MNYHDLFFNVFHFIILVFSTLFGESWYISHDAFNVKFPAYFFSNKAALSGGSGFRIVLATLCICLIKFFLFWLTFNILWLIRVFLFFFIPSLWYFNLLNVMKVLCALYLMLLAVSFIWHLKLFMVSPICKNCDLYTYVLAVSIIALSVVDGG